MDMNAVDGLVQNMLISIIDPTITIIGLTRDNKNLMPKSDKRLADIRNGKALWIVMLADDEDSHVSNYYRHHRFTQSARRGRSAYVDALALYNALANHG